MSKKIAEMLLQYGSVTLRPEEPFIWASGIHSPVYCDNRILLSHPKARDQLVESFEDMIKKNRLRFDAVAGIATGGIPVASILADRLKKPLLYVRSGPKGHGKGNVIEGQFKRGSRVLVIEDLVSTGKSSLAAIQALKQDQARVTDCLAIFSYGFPAARVGFQRARCKLHTLTNLKTLMETAIRLKKITAKDRNLIESFARAPEEWKAPTQSLGGWKIPPTLVRLPERQS